MKSCPGCEFLIDDTEDVCEFCAADPGYASKLKGYTTKTVVGALADSETGLSSSVGILERPVPSAVNWSETDLTPPENPHQRERLTLTGSEQSRSNGDVESLEFRKGRSGVPTPVVIVVVVIGLIGLLYVSVNGKGPLGDTFAKFGLARTPASVLPGQWAEASEMSDIFKVEMPVGATVIFEGLDPTGAVPGGIAGLKVNGNNGAWMMASTSDLGLGAQGLGAYDSDEGLSELASRFASARIPGSRTVERSELLAHGRANDSVIVAENKDGTSTETRLRVVLVGDRLIELVTSGPSSAAAELDAAHQRLIQSLVPTI